MRHTHRYITTAALILSGALLAGPALAGPPSFDRAGGGGKGPANVSRTLRAAESGVVRGGSHQSSRSSRPSGGMDSGRNAGYRGQGAGFGGGETPLLNALLGASGNNGYRGGSGLENALSELSRTSDRYNYRETQRKREEEYLDLQRTQMITNAVVGVVGILAATQAQKHQQQGGYYAPAPVQVAAPAPAGYYETQRVLVQDGYYANQQVWVPEYRDPSTGTIIDGHYETHRRWVAPVYQETQVWVCR